MSTTRTGIKESLQISHLETLSAGAYAPGKEFLIKNISGEMVNLSVRMARDAEFIATSFYPGWNPEICIEIESVEDGTIQVGY